MEEDNIDFVMQQSMLALLDIKPKDPISFLASHYQLECETSNLIAKAVHILQNVTIEHPALDERLLKTYTILSQFNDEEGITGDIYTDLLAKLVTDLPSQGKEKFLAHVQCRSTEYVCFTVFRSGILSCLLLNQFIAEAKVLFSNLCGEMHDFAPAYTCRKALKRLGKSLNQTPKEMSKSQETGTSLGTELNASVKRSSTLRTSPPREYMKLNAFLLDGIDIFLQEIPKLK